MFAIRIVALGVFARLALLNAPEVAVAGHLAFLAAGAQLLDLGFELLESLETGTLQLVGRYGGADGATGIAPVFAVVK